jgi:methyl-CpG-binding domain protein 4
MDTWKPPRSPYKLIQEDLYSDPWKVLVACIFCNLTRRHTAEPLLWKFFSDYPTPFDASSADIKELENLLKPIGLSSRRAKTLKRMSTEYFSIDWKEPVELYGIGKYGNDAWKIFCTNEWKSAAPKDHALSWYHTWLLENFT